MGDALPHRPGDHRHPVRLPQVHDTERQGLISPYIDLAREKGVAAYIGEGLNRWSAAQVLDVAKLYALALDKGEPGRRYHAVAEEGGTMREIAGTVSAGLDVPVKSLSPDEAKDHFGWLAVFAGLDMRASSAWTRQALGWNPTGPDLLTDLRTWITRPAEIPAARALRRTARGRTVPHTICESFSTSSPVTASNSASV